MKNQTYRMTMLFDFYGELLTDRQKELLEEFEKISSGLDLSQTPRKKSFWEKVGDLFSDN